MSICFIESGNLFFLIKTNKKQIKTNKKTKLEKKKNKTNRKQNQKRGKSPHTPTLYPCIVLNVFNMYKMQRKSMKGTYLLKVEGVREKSSSSYPSSYSTYIDFH